MSGFMECGLAALGIQASSPNGFKFLPSYMVLAFCNGTMKVLLSLEMYNYGHVLRAVMGPFGMVKIAGIVVLTSPFMIFGGLLLAWELHKELRGLAVQAALTNLPIWAPQSEGATAQVPQAQAETASDPVEGGTNSAPAAASPQSGNSSPVFRPFSGQPQRLTKDASQRSKS